MYVPCFASILEMVNNTNHQIKKEDQMPIIEIMKKILYSPSGPEMDMHYNEFKQRFYNYNLLRKHFDLLWNCRQFWALSFRVGLPNQKTGSNTNNGDDEKNPLLTVRSR